MRIPAARRRSIAPAASSVLDREMAAVEADLDMFEKPLAGLVFSDPQRGSEERRAGRQQSLREERQRFVGVFQRAIGFGLDVEVDRSSIGLLDTDQGLGDADDVSRDRIPRRPIVDCHPRLVRERSRRDAAFSTVRQQAAQNLDQILGVTNARSIAPVRRVHLGLDDGAVKGTVRESVDERHVQPVLVEKAAERLQSVSLQQLSRFPRGEAKTQTERCRGREPGFELRGVVFEVGENRIPPVGGMDVRAVREVEVVPVRQPHVIIEPTARRFRAPVRPRLPAGCETSVTG